MQAVDVAPDDTEKRLMEGLAEVERDLLSLHKMVQSRASLHMPLQPQLQDPRSATFFANMNKVLDSVSRIERLK